MNLADRLEAHPRRYLLLFTAWYAAAEVCLNLRRPFWFDELIGGWLADRPAISDIWGFIGKGVELNPPLPFWTQWTIHHLLGSGEILSRLHSITGFWLMCVCLFYFVRRRTDAAYGFVALLLPVFTFTSWYGTYARSYGMMLGASGVMLLAWQCATEGIRRRVALALMGVSVAVAVSCHYYGLYVAGAIGAGELVRGRIRGRWDGAVIGALVVGATPLLAYLPLIRRATSLTFWVQAELGFIYESYVELAGAMIMITLLWQWLNVVGDEPLQTAPRPMGLPVHEGVACLLLAAMPLILGIVAQFIKIGFYKYYVQPVVIGATVIVALFAYRVSGGSAKMRAATLNLAVFCGFVPWGLFQLLKVGIMPTPAQAVMRGYGGALDSGLPVVIDNNDRYLALRHYASPAQRERLFVLDDKAASLRFLGSDLALNALEAMNAAEPLHLMPYASFTAQHEEFLVVMTTPESWLTQKLVADGANVQLAALQKDPGPFAERLFVFRVRASDVRQTNAQRLR